MERSLKNCVFDAWWSVRRALAVSMLVLFGIVVVALIIAALANPEWRGVFFAVVAIFALIFGAAWGAQVMGESNTAD